MTIEIRRPELAALIRERMTSGGFHDAEDVLLHALKNSPLPEAAKASTGADLIAAMQSSPYRKLEIEPGPERDPKA